MIKKIWYKWRKLSKAIVNFQSRILLAIIYFIFISPIAIAMQFLNNDILQLKKPPKWFIRKQKLQKINSLSKQY